jgi:hypothetical protein
MGRFLLYGAALSVAIMFVLESLLVVAMAISGTLSTHH